MLRIVEDLMSLSRIEADRFVAPAERVNVGEIVRLACENGRHLAESRGCRIQTSIEDGLPDVHGDFAQLLQVADNLVSNAVRYGCSASSPEVTVSARRDGGSVVLGVRDRGEGIPAIHIPRLTERFYRVDAGRSRQMGGTGLGLAIVKHIINRHRGALTIDSEVGRGSVFTLYLPAEATAPTPETIAATLAKGGAKTVRAPERGEP